MVSGATFAQQVRTYVAKNTDDPGRSHELVQWANQNYLSGDAAARIAFLQENLAVLGVPELTDLISLSGPANAGATIEKWSAGRSYRDTLDARMQLFPQFVAGKDKAGLLAGARDYLAAYPTTFNKDHVAQWIIAQPLVEKDEKLALLKEAIDAAGYTEPMKALLEGMTGNGKWAKDAAFIELKAAFDQKPAGKDPAAATLVALAAIKQKPNNPDLLVLETVSKFLDDYKSQIPAGDDRTTNGHDLLVQQIFDAHAAHVWKNADAMNELAALWTPRLGVNGNGWERITNRLREMKADSSLTKLIPVYAAAVRTAGGAGKGSAVVWRNLQRPALSDDKAIAAFSSVYDAMGADAAFGYLFNMRSAWDAKRPMMATELAKAVAATGGKITDPVVMRGLLGHEWGLANGNAPVSPVVTKTIWDSYVADLAKGGAIDLPDEARTHNTYTASKHDAEAAAWLADYLQLLEKRTPEQRLAALNELYHWSLPPLDQPAHAMNAGSRRSILLKQMKPLFDAIPPRDFDAQAIMGNAVLELNAAATAVVPTGKNVDPRMAGAVAEQRKQSLDLGRLWLRMIDAGAKLDAPAGYFFGVGREMYAETLASGNRAALADAARQYGRLLARENVVDVTWSERVAPVLKELEDRGADEAEYVFVSAVQQGKPVEAVAKQLMLAKAKAATKIRGLIPVPAADPAYDLYLASASLMGGDESRAWELTSPKLKLLTTTWEGFDARYIAWSVEQMRKQKLLKEGLEFSFNILLHESELDADVAGRVLLSQSDIYKDMENYQAARIGYEGLKVNNRYNKTEPGQRAIYRLIELHILTKDYTAAESLLERMVDADDVKKQAEAYYLYALMAYQQAQYKESKEYLRKVKDRVANHVEAALLEGELNLILPGGLANTEVAIGDARLSTVVIPGRYLTLQLQDPNLSVARGGAAIPVIITTSKGGDVEHVKLIPSSSNKSLFTARIATALGHAQKDNLTLELVGDDVVSYRIDPEFQKANDLHYPPKVLEVRSDARLVASSGEILSEEEEEKRELERQLQRRLVIESRRLEIARDGRTIRPGSPDLRAGDRSRSRRVRCRRHREN